MTFSAWVFAGMAIFWLLLAGAASYDLEERYRTLAAIVMLLGLANIFTLLYVTERYLAW